MKKGSLGQKCNRKKNFIDFQVLEAIRRNNGCNMYNLLKICKKEYPLWFWTYGELWVSVRRLEKAGKVMSVVSLENGRACRKIFVCVKHKKKSSS
jgi:hypothetical protein